MTQKKCDIRDIYLELDIQKMDIDHDGVKNFYWPVSYNERESFCNDLMRAYTNLIQEHDGRSDTLSYKLFSKYFINEAIATFNSDLLRGRLYQGGYYVQCRNEWRLWSSLFQKQQPSAPVFMMKFKEGPHNSKKKASIKIIQKIKKGISLFNIKNRGISFGDLKIKPLTSFVLKNSIIATQRTDLIQQHASMVDKDVVFCRSERWFSGVSDEELQQEMKKGNEELKRSLLLFLEDKYKEYGVDLEVTSLAYLDHLISQGTALLRIHYRRLIEMPHKLPHHVWTGTGGNTWDALLRLASLSIYNGDSVGHDHGAGLGHVDNPAMAMREFWGCKEFICLNQNQAQEMAERAPNWYLYDKKLPDILGISSKNSVQEFKKFASSCDTKTIIVLATLYGGDRVWMGPCSPDIVHVDWQARLISKLKSWGYEVILKVHPETPVMPPIALQNLGATIRTEPLEDIISEGDLVLFDCLYTSVFKSVLSTNVPMVLIDFYNHPWTSKAKNLINKRIGMMSGQFDKQNRSDVNWSILKKMIDVASEKNKNHEFFNYYYH